MTAPRRGFDPDALRARYRREREKRRRPEGIAQYRQVAGALARFADDPYLDPGYTRAPLRDAVVVIGGGVGDFEANAS